RDVGSMAVEGERERAAYTSQLPTDTDDGAGVSFLALRTDARRERQQNEGGEKEQRPLQFHLKIGSFRTSSVTRLLVNRTRDSKEERAFRLHLSQKQSRCRSSP